MEAKEKLTLYIRERRCWTLLRTIWLNVGSEQYEDHTVGPSQAKKPPTDKPIAADRLACAQIWRSFAYR